MNVIMIGEVVSVAPLIAGDGIDLVTHPTGRRSRTQQLTIAEARELAAAITRVADQSEADRRSKIKAKARAKLKGKK